MARNLDAPFIKVEDFDNLIQLLNNSPVSNPNQFFVDATERRKAIELLQDCKEQVILPHLGEKGLEVEVTGLEIMNDDQVHFDLAMAVCDQVILI